MKQGPIGIFDSGYGGLTILEEIRRLLPDYDYLYLGDNARAPYGVRSYDVVYRFTLESVKFLFEQGCPLVILACNTASAKALRTIQQCDLPLISPWHRVLGVIRPTVEQIGKMSKSGHIGVLGTPGTINSESYNMEIAKLYPTFRTIGHACPMWVPLIENGESSGPGADYFVEKEIDNMLAKDKDIDTVILACTHYPLLINKIRRYLPSNVNIVTQGELVASSLGEYLKRHKDMDSRLLRGGSCRFLTTENSNKFSQMASIFLNEDVDAKTIVLNNY